MWDISAPIVVDGQHWGAFRIGYSIQTVEAQLWDATRNMLIGMGVILVVLGACVW